MAFTVYIPVVWIPAIHAGMMPLEFGVRLLLIKKCKAVYMTQSETGCAAYAADRESILSKIKYARYDRSRSAEYLGISGVSLYSLIENIDKKFIWNPKAKKLTHKIDSPPGNPPILYTVLVLFQCLKLPANRLLSVA